MTFTILKTCPVCNSFHDNHCRQAGDLYFCRGTSGGDQNGFRFIKMTRNDVWGIYVKSNRQTASYTHVAAQKDDNTHPDFDVYAEFESGRKLSPYHKIQLIKRGVTDFSPFFSIDKLTTYEFARIHGMYIKCTGFQGRTLGYQVAPDNKNMSKYMWASKGGSARILGEMPVQLARGSKSPRTVILCEGTLKPLVARDRQGYTFIGASGGNWCSSKKLIHKMLKALEADNVLVAPDAGSMANDSVWLNVNRACQEFNATVIDWGQLEDKNAEDVDELDNNVLSW
jgi:hypothetical protein